MHLAAIVLLAELAAAGFLVAYSLMILSMVREGRALVPARPDAIGRTLITSARTALIAGYATFFALTVYWMF